MEFIGIIIVFLLIVFIYFFPTWIAAHNKKKNLGAIVALNIFLGWTFVGWVLAFVWACCKD